MYVDERVGDKPNETERGGQREKEGGISQVCEKDGDM